MNIFLIIIIGIVTSERAQDEDYDRLMNWYYSFGGESIPFELKKFSQTNRILISRQKIIPGEIIMFVPENLTITASNPVINATCSKVFNQDKVIDQECLAYYLYLHFNDEASIFYPYFRYMTLSFNEYPMFYTESDKLKINNTNLFERKERFLYRISQSYYRIIEALNDTSIHFQTYINCFYWISSRAFTKKTKNLTLISLVPVFELFNYHPSKLNTNWQFNEFRNGWALIATKTIEPYEEIFVDYGKNSNEDLLFKYGYTLADNIYLGTFNVVIKNNVGRIEHNIESNSTEIYSTIVNMTMGKNENIEDQIICLTHLSEITVDRINKYPSEEEMNNYEATFNNENIIRVINEEKEIAERSSKHIERFIADLKKKDIHDIKKMRAQGISPKYCDYLIGIIEKTQN